MIVKNILCFPNGNEINSVSRGGTTLWMKMYDNWVMNIGRVPKYR